MLFLSAKSGGLATVIPGYFQSRIGGGIRPSNAVLSLAPHVAGMDVPALQEPDIIGSPVKWQVPDVCPGAGFTHDVPVSIPIPNVAEERVEVTEAEGRLKPGRGIQLRQPVPVVFLAVEIHGRLREEIGRAHV